MSRQPGEPKFRNVRLQMRQPRQCVQPALALTERFLEDAALRRGAPFGPAVEQAWLHQVGGDASVTQADAGTDGQFAFDAEPPVVRHRTTRAFEDLSGE